MKKLIIVFIAIFSINFCVGQELKVIGGNEKNVKVKRGASEWIDVAFKNESNTTIFVKNIRCSNSEVSIPEISSGRVDVGGKRTFKFRITPKHSGKQRFQVYVDYEDKSGSKGKSYFVVAINPKY